VRHILIILISFLLLSSPVIGQSGKPLGVIFPPTIMGNVSESRQQILLNTLDDEISQYFDVSPRTNVSSGELPLVEDVFQLQIVEEDGDTQLSLRWTSGNERKVETILCGGCKTIELNGKLEELVGKVVRGKMIEPVGVVGKKQIGVLFGTRVKFKWEDRSEWKWYKNDDEDRYGRYKGEIENGLPNGQGVVKTVDGKKYVGEWKDGVEHGQGTYTFPDGKKTEGEFKLGKPWNSIGYDKNGNKKVKWTFGKLQEIIFLYKRYVNGFWRWYQHGDEKKDGTYVGEIENEEPNGHGTLTNTNGTKSEGEWSNGEMWNGTLYDKNGNILGKWVNGNFQ
jgi:hypothetical protein